MVAKTARYLDALVDGSAVTPALDTKKPVEGTAPEIVAHGDVHNDDSGPPHTDGHIDTGPDPHDDGYIDNPA